MKWKAYGRYGSLGIELIVSMAVGYFIGKWLDDRVGAGGWLTGLFTVAGVYAGFRALFKAAKQMERDIEKEEKLERGQAPWKVPMPDGYEDEPAPPKASPEDRASPDASTRASRTSEAPPARRAPKEDDA